MSNVLSTRLGLAILLIQAPIAGVSTPTMAAAVSNAGALGDRHWRVQFGGCEAMIAHTRQLTKRPLDVNLFCHRRDRATSDRDAAGCGRPVSLFERFGAIAPGRLREIYTTFLADEKMLAVLLRQRPAVVSFHFGLPPATAIDALRSTGAIVPASVTSVATAEVAAAARVDAVVAQGYEAGGHRGTFDENATDDPRGTLALRRLLVARQRLPVIAAGDIMDGQVLWPSCRSALWRRNSVLPSSRARSPPQMRAIVGVDQRGDGELLGRREDRMRRRRGQVERLAPAGEPSRDQLVISHLRRVRAEVAQR